MYKEKEVVLRSSIQYLVRCFSHKEFTIIFQWNIERIFRNAYTEESIRDFM